MKEIAVLECENGKIFRARSLRARSHNLDFLNVSVLSDTVVYSAIPYEKIKAYNYVLRRSLASLARAYKLHVYDFFFMSVHLGACPTPHPYTKKLATLLLPDFAHQKSGQMKMADSVPPTRYTKSPPLALGKRIPELQTQIQSLQDTLQAFQTEKGELSKEIQSLKEIIEGKDERICVLEGRVHDLECTNDKQKSSLDSHKKTLERHGNKIAALERNEDQMQQYSRRNCIRVFGIPEEQVENTDDKICRLVREKLGVCIKKEDIDRSHRVGKKSTSKPRGIIVKLVSYRTCQ